MKHAPYIAGVLIAALLMSYQYPAEWESAQHDADEIVHAQHDARVAMKGE
jgi:hypothetical protein